SNSNLTFLNELPTRHTQKQTEKQPQAVPAGTSKKRRQQILIACAAGGLALMLLAAIVVIVRDGDKEVARVKVPAEGSIVVESSDLKSETPGAKSSLPTPPKTAKVPKTKPPAATSGGSWTVVDAQ